MCKEATNGRKLKPSAREPKRNFGTPTLVTQKRGLAAAKIAALTLNIQARYATLQRQYMLHYRAMARILRFLINLHGG